MNIFPAIDLIDKKVVRLFKGDYAQKTVYNDNPLEVALGFKKAGAEYLHTVDLDGAKSGSRENLDVISTLINESGLKVEIGGGIRTMEAVESYINIGAFKVIIGTAAVTDSEFLKTAVKEYGDKIAVGADIKDGYVAIKGWTEKSEIECFDFFSQMCDVGVKNIICTDISKDGAMVGTNHELYKSLSEKFDIDITASGGVSSIDDVKKLNTLGVYGAIIGKALYNGAINLEDAVKISKGELI